MKLVYVVAAAVLIHRWMHAQRAYRLGMLQGHKMGFQRGLQARIVPIRIDPLMPPPPDADLLVN